MAPNTRRPPKVKQDGTDTNTGYGGLLTEPMPVLVSEVMERFGQPGWFSGNSDDWQSAISQIRVHEHAEWSKREKALGDVFGITIDCPPNESDPWHRLAFALAERHVPAFERGEVHDQYFKTRRAKTRVLTLSPEGTFLLSMWAYQAMLAGLTTRDTIAREVVRCGVPKWRQGTPPELARLPETFAKDPSDIDTISFNSARALIPKLRDAWKDALAGRADTFQCQVLAIALGTWSFATAPGSPEGDTWRILFGLKPPDDVTVRYERLLEDDVVTVPSGKLPN